MQTVNIRVSGLVQGVFFRKSTKTEAEKLGLAGWVRNESDGSVEIMAAGDKAKLEELISWCKKGPPLAKVENVELDWLKEVEDFEEFSVI